MCQIDQDQIEDKQSRLSEKTNERKSELNLSWIISYGFNWSLKIQIVTTNTGIYCCQCQTSERSRTILLQRINQRMLILLF